MLAPQTSTLNGSQPARLQVSDGQADCWTKIGTSTLATRMLRVKAVLMLLGVLGTLGGTFSSAFAQQGAAPSPTPLSGPTPVAAPVPAPPASEDPLAIVTSFSEKYGQAFNAAKIDDLIALWRATGTYEDETDGLVVTGHAALKEGFGNLFKDNPGLRIIANVQSVRPVTREVLMFEGIVTTTAPESDATVSSFEAVLVKEGNQWLLDSVKESATVEGKAMLQNLAWLVGEWRDDNQDVSIETTVRWSSQQAFLIRAYKVRVGEEISHEGTQVIGWDAQQKTIRSWNFESDGAFGEGLWTLASGEWTIRNTLTLADGTRGSSRQILRPESADAYTVESVGRELGGVPLPSTGEIRVIRVNSELMNQVESAPNANVPGR